MTPGTGLTLQHMLLCFPVNGNIAPGGEKCLYMEAPDEQNNSLEVVPSLSGQMKEFSMLKIRKKNDLGKQRASQPNNS